MSQDDAVSVQFINRVRESLFECGIDVLLRETKTAQNGVVQVAAQRGTEVLSCGTEHIQLGVAVSGGADSVALFVALAHILKTLPAALHVITINHNMRSEKESLGDVQHVQQLCTDFAARGFSVDCTCVTFERGAVAQCAEQRGGGKEEAARFLRYKAFEDFAAQKNLFKLCLAHTKNDNVETVLMRFLHGGSALGIKKTRGIFARPLLNVTRAEIERFLNAQHISWRTDSTNDDISYERNKMRRVVIPFLNTAVPEWQSAVLLRAQKTAEDDDALSEIAAHISWRADESKKMLCLERVSFCAQKRAVQMRLLYRAFNEVAQNAVASRVPYRFVERICNAARSSSVFKESVAGVCVELDERTVCVKKAEASTLGGEQNVADCGFFAIVERAGTYSLPFGTISATVAADGKMELAFERETTARESCVCHVPVSFPFCIRSRQVGDEIATAHGGAKAVSDIFSNWKVSLADRARIPLVQELPSQEIVCILGSVCGYSDWTVKRR
ncbi:MAG: tRNA lysidine(34) synthetase TilS [Treponema sp.]|nr:tRNA lysidine(34) synthetase TilS [Treponema sp.]